MAVQCVPHLARACGELYVFQRTPSSVDVRANVPIDPDWFASIATPGWQQRWLENFTEQIRWAAQRPKTWFRTAGPSLSQRIRSNMKLQARARRSADAAEGAGRVRGFRFPKRWRRSARGSTPSRKDRETAQKLKAWYRQLCKRPCFHDEYPCRLSTRWGCWLIDHPDGKGVERITEKGVAVAGVDYEVDCIIYASGFEVGTEYTRRAGFDLTGRGGVKALAKPECRGHEVACTVFTCTDFPMPSLCSSRQGANLITNIPHNLTEAGQTIAMVVRRRGLDSGCRKVEVTPEAQDAWVALLLTGMGSLISSPDAHLATTTTRDNRGPRRGSTLAIQPAPRPISNISTHGANPRLSRAWPLRERVKRSLSSSSR